MRAVVLAWVMPLREARNEKAPCMYATKTLIKPLLCFLLAMLASSAALSATYVYAGPPYTTVYGIYTTSMRITGSFTTANPLPPNLSNVEIGPSGLNLVVGWHFDNGVTTFTTDNSVLCSVPCIGVNGAFVVSTDGVGNITAFLISLQNPPNAYGWVDNVVTFILGTSPIQYWTWNQPACFGGVCPGPSSAGSAQTAGSFITVQPYQRFHREASCSCGG
jgi:hypothetical protein